MKLKYKQLPELTTADIAYEIYGKNLNELFENSALALFNTMCNLKKVKQKIKKIIKLKNENSQDLLFDFIEELIFLKDSKYILFSKFKVKIKNNELQAECFGENINQAKHQLKVDVKAITYHKFELKKMQGHRGRNPYIATMVLDI